MKKDILSLTLSALCVLSACSNDDEEWRYGEEQALNATEWIRVGAVYDAADSWLRRASYSALSPRRCGNTATW